MRSSRRILRPLLGALSTAACLGAITAPVAAALPTCTAHWQPAGANVNWSTAANWKEGVVPGASAVVCITATATSAPTVDQAETVSSVQAALPVTLDAALTMTDPANVSAFTVVDLTGGGALDSDATATISQALNWTGGDIGGTGGTIQLLNGSTLMMDGSPFSYDYAIDAGDALVNDGGGQWTQGYASMATGARWTNAASFTDDSSDGSILRSTAALTDAAPLLVNAAGGTWTSTPTGSTQYPNELCVPLENAGTVTATTGILVLGGGGPVASTGSFTGTGAQLAIGDPAGASGCAGYSPLTLGTGATLTGISVERSGALTVPVQNTVAASGLTFDYGDIDAEGTLDISGTDAFYGGVLSGAGEVVQAASGTLTIDPRNLTTDNTIGTDITGNLVTDGTVELTGGLEAVGGTWTLNSPLTVSSTTTGMQPATVANLQTIGTVINNSTLSFTAAAAPSNGSEPVITTNVVNHGTITSVPSGIGIGQNSFFGTTDVTNSGTIANLDITGRMVGAAGGQLLGVELSGSMLIPSNVTVAGENLTLDPYSGTIAGGGTLVLGGNTAWGGLDPVGGVLIDLPVGANLTVDGPVTMAGGAELATDGTTQFASYPPADGSGTGSLALGDDADWVNTGTIELGAGSIETGDGSYGSSTNLGYRPELYNVGTVAEAANVNGTIAAMLNDGTLDAELGNISIAALADTPAAVNEVGISGSGYGSGYGTITAGCGLAGTLKVNTGASYTPALGETFTPITDTGSPSGLGCPVQASDPFGADTGLGLDGESESYAVTYSGSGGYSRSVVLTVVDEPPPEGSVAVVAGSSGSPQTDVEPAPTLAGVTAVAQSPSRHAVSSLVRVLLTLGHPAVQHAVTHPGFLRHTAGARGVRRHQRTHRRRPAARVLRSLSRAPAAPLSRR